MDLAGSLVTEFQAAGPATEKGPDDQTSNAGVTV